jgi:hypothetical protein
MTDEYKKLKAKSDPQSKKILNALERTLDFYKIKEKRPLMANAILKFSNIKSNMIPSDDETKNLLQMTETFELNARK